MHLARKNLYEESLNQSASSDEILGATDEVEIDLGTETVKIRRRGKPTIREPKNEGL